MQGGKRGDEGEGAGPTSVGWWVRVRWAPGTSFCSCSLRALRSILLRWTELAGMASMTPWGSWRAVPDMPMSAIQHTLSNTTKG